MHAARTLMSISVLSLLERLFSRQEPIQEWSAHVHMHMWARSRKWLVWLNSGCVSSHDMTPRSHGFSQGYYTHLVLTSAAFCIGHMCMHVVVWTYIPEPIDLCNSPDRSYWRPFVKQPPFVRMHTALKALSMRCIEFEKEGIMDRNVRIPLWLPMSLLLLRMCFQDALTQSRRMWR